MSGFITPPTTIVLDSGQTYTDTIRLEDGTDLTFTRLNGGILATRDNVIEKIYGTYWEGDVPIGGFWTPYLTVTPSGGITSATIQSLDPTMAPLMQDFTGSQLRVRMYDLVNRHEIITAYHYRLWVMATSF